MACTLLTGFLRKLKNEVERNSALNRKTFPNDDKKCIESANKPAEPPGASNLVACKDPSSFRMENEIDDKDSRRESEDSLLKFAIHFSKDNDNSSSSSGQSDTTSSRHNVHGNNIHGRDSPASKSKHADTGTGGENMKNGQNNNQHDTDHISDQLSSDAVNGIDQKNPDTNEWDENEQSDNLNTNGDHYGDEKSFTLEESQSSSSTPSSGINSHNGGLRQRRSNGKNDDVVIEIEEENEKEHFQTPAGHVESYLYIMQFLGISGFRRVEYQSSGIFVAILLKGLFWIVSAGAFLNSLRILKRVAVERAPADKDLEYCVKIGFAVIRCFSRFYFIKVVGTQSEKLSVMLLHIRNPRLFTSNGEFSFSMVATILATTTFFFTIIKVLFGYLLVDEWNWNDALQSRSFYLASALFVWGSDYNTTNALEQELFSNPTLIHTVMGLIEGFLDFCGTLQGEAIRDLLILACVTIHIDQTAIEQRIQPQLLVHPNNTDSAELEGSLRHFKCVNHESSSINGTLGTPFKFVTIQNLLLYAYLFVQLIGYKGMTMSLIYSIVDALKGLALFYIGMRLHWKNSSIKKWLHLMSSYKGPVDIEAILGMSVQSAISDFRDDPIGLGSDYFLINETFMIGLIAAVGSLISLLFEFDRFQAAIRRLLL